MAKCKFLVYSPMFDNLRMHTIEIAEALVVELCQLNELANFVSPWIILAPSLQLEGNIHHSLFVLVYAMAEQCLTFLCHYMAWHPIIAIGTAPQLELFASFVLAPLFGIYRSPGGYPQSGLQLDLTDLKRIHLAYIILCRPGIIRLKISRTKDLGSSSW